MIRQILAASLLLGLTFQGMQAQTVRGRLLDRETGTPIAAGFVTLRDSAGADAGAALADPQGVFTVRAARPGRFTVQVERLGYRTIASDTIELSRGQVLVRDFLIAATAVTLPSIEISAETRCRGRRELAAEAAAVWEEVRKALTVARWTGESGRIRYEVYQYERRLDPRTLEVEREQRSTATLENEGSPYSSSLPARDLIEGGFAREDSGYWVYDGPDAEVLLSDEFLDSHCFRATTDRARPRLVGLAFEPSGGTQPAIRGTLWIDRSTFELSHVEFRYIRLPWRVDADEAGGRVEFRRLPDGGWIVESWWLRSPIISRRLGSSRQRLDGYTEIGREVTAMYRPDGSRIR